ncbi:hypothetical protein RRG08_043299 [Elysia crispata]|uniref:TM2 domain-containing protein n=1 Tax=Elysia crispata TaxID=231223 RepID=A0AAE0XZ15_9GAST|nr:hypothetical protein RRG08_043299 [Elysia crispata]
MARSFIGLVLCFSVFSLEFTLGSSDGNEYLMDDSTGHTYDSQRALVYCTFLPLEFLNCSDPEDLKGNVTKRNEQGYGCTKWGGEKFEDVQKTSVWCTALPGIECFGNRTFLRDGFPCIKYNGHYFVTTLIYSVFLGFLGMDRFCLGHTGTAVGKLITLGGVGIWWIIDIVLLVTGQLKPVDKSNWVPYY